MSNITKIDGDDSSIIYMPESSWVRTGRMMETKMAQATVLISFYGTQICAYGAIESPDDVQGPLLSCRMDGQSARNPAQSSDKSVACFCNATLPLSNHTFTITNLVNDSHLYIDHFLVSQPIADESLPHSGPIFSIASIMVSSPTRTYHPPLRTYSSATSSSMTAYSPTISLVRATGSTTASSHHGKVIAATIGGLALSVIAALAVVWLVKRRRRANRWKAPSAMFADSQELNLDNYPYTGK